MSLFNGVASSQSISNQTQLAGEREQEVGCRREWAEKGVPFVLSGRCCEVGGLASEGVMSDE